MILQCSKNLYMIETHDVKERAEPDLLTASSRMPCISSASRLRFATSTLHSLKTKSLSPTSPTSPPSFSRASFSTPSFSRAATASSSPPPSGRSAMASPRFRRPRITCTSTCKYYGLWLQAVHQKVHTSFFQFPHLFNVGLRCCNLCLRRPRHTQANP